MFRLLVAFAVFTIGAAHQQRFLKGFIWGPRPKPTPGPVAVVCEEKPVELGIVFDSSRSVFMSEFRQGMLLVRELIKYYDIGPSKTRVALVICADKVQIDMSFGLSKFKTREAMAEYLNGIDHIYGKSSRTGNAIDFMRKVYLAPPEVRSDVTKVMVVITDGHFKNWTKTEQAAAEAMADGIETVALGIGKNMVNSDELLKITGGCKDRVVTSKNYFPLINVLKELREVVCRCIKLPTSSTTKTPMTTTPSTPTETISTTIPTASTTKGTIPTTIPTASTTTGTISTTIPTASTTKGTIPTTIPTASTTKGTIPTTIPTASTTTGTISTTTVTPTPREPECEAELAIIMDSSESIPTGDFKHGKQIALDLIAALDIGPSNVRIAFTLYGGGIYTDISFSLDTFSRKEDIVNFIKNVPHLYGEKTHTAQAIRYMTRQKLAAHLVRKDVKKFGLVITDGNSKDVAASAEASHEAATENITMLAVGVGKEIHNAEIVAIAGGRVSNAKDYPSTVDLAKELKDEICALPTITTDTPTTIPTSPRPTPSACDRAVYVYFIYSESDLGREHTQTTLEMLELMYNITDLNPHNRYGIIGDNCWIQAHLDLTVGLEFAEHVSDLRAHASAFKLPALIRQFLLRPYPPRVEGCKDNVLPTRVAVVFSKHPKEFIKMKPDLELLVEWGVKVAHIDFTNKADYIDGVSSFYYHGVRLTSKMLGDYLKTVMLQW